MPFARLLACLAVALASLLPAHADTFLRLSSQSADPVLRGASRSFTAADGAFQVARQSDGGVAVTFTTPTNTAFWNLYFGAAAGALVPGSYSLAERYFFHSPGRPGLEVNGEHIGCNELDGSFVVHELVVATDGTITSFAADFEQHCDHRYGAMVGGVRVNSAIPYVAPVPAPLPVVNLAMIGEFGDYILGGFTRTITDDTTNMTVFPMRNDELGFYYQGGGGNFWNLDFAAISGQTLGPGTYDDAQRAPFRSAGHPGLDVGGEGRGCNTLRGRFAVREIERDAYRVTRLAIDFEQHCEGAAPALYGAFRLNSPVPISLPAVQIPSAISLAVPVPTVPAGGLANIAIAVTDTNGVKVPGMQVSISATCGTFLGSSGFDAVTDGTGYANIPWVAPRPTSATSCNFYAYLTARSSIGTTFTVQVAPLPPATALAFVDGNRSFRIGTAATLFPVRVATVTADGTAVPGQSVTATATCGRFAGVSSTYTLTSDSLGVATFPSWIAPDTPTNCVITVRLDSNPSANITFNVEVFSSNVATRFAMIDTSNTFYATPGGTASGVHFATVNDAMNRVGNQPVVVTSLIDGCGSYSGMSALNLTSDAQGVVQLPVWTAPMTVTNCVYKASLPNSPGNDLIFYYNVLQSLPGVSADLVYPTVPQSPYTVAPGGTVGPITLLTAASAGQAVASQSVTIRSTPAGCGSFGGAEQVVVASNGSGLATTPTWTAGSSAQTCRLSFELTGKPSSGTGVDVRVVTSSAPPPPPPPGAPVTSATGTAPGGGSITLALSSTVAECTLARASFIDPATISPPVAPLPNVANLAMPHGLIDFRADNCGTARSVTFNIDYPQELPPTAQWWKYGPTPDNHTPHWYLIPSTVSGKRLSFTITDGAVGDDDLMANGSITDIGMVAIPGGTMQDLWWSGIAENGWGMTLVQHRDVLFGNMFVYDANGVATWYVLPSGSWNTAHTVYTGDLYLPKGSPYFAYDVSKFDIGPSVGNARITFNSVNEAVLEYTINGVSGRKNISRIPFGPAAPPTDKPMGDLWWAGLAQNGWGLVLSQQYATLFGLWFTYDANGKATWFVMPNVEFVSKDTYRGNIYRPEGSAWLGATYDPSRHRTVQVGTFNLRFTGDGATFDYTVDGKSGSIPISRIPF